MSDQNMDWSDTMSDQVFRIILNSGWRHQIGPRKIVLQSANNSTLVTFLQHDNTYENTFM
jgi:hypothetical protein